MYHLHAATAALHSILYSSGRVDAVSISPPFPRKSEFARASLTSPSLQAGYAAPSPPQSARAAMRPLVVAALLFVTVCGGGARCAWGDDDKDDLTQEELWALIAAENARYPPRADAIVRGVAAGALPAQNAHGPQDAVPPPCVPTPAQLVPVQGASSPRPRQCALLDGVVPPLSPPHCPWGSGRGIAFCPGSEKRAGLTSFFLMIRALLVRAVQLFLALGVVEAVGVPANSTEASAAAGAPTLSCCNGDDSFQHDSRFDGQVRTVGSKSAAGISTSRKQRGTAFRARTSHTALAVEYTDAGLLCHASCGSPMPRVVGHRCRVLCFLDFRCRAIVASAAGPVGGWLNLSLCGNLTST